MYNLRNGSVLRELDFSRDEPLHLLRLRSRRLRPGGLVTYLDPSGSQLGHKESIADTARGPRPHVRRDRISDARC